MDLGRWGHFGYAAGRGFCRRALHLGTNCRASTGRFTCADAGGRAESWFRAIAGAYSDAGCTAKIDDPYLAKVVQSIRFKPALEQGQPVDGIATVNLSRFKT